MVTVEADMENNAEAFWAALGEQFPSVASELRSNGTARVSEQDWLAIQNLEGFSNGPDYARDALIINETR